MKKIKFFGWNAGMRPLRFAQLRHDDAGIGLKEAWDIKTRLLNGETVVVKAPEVIADFIPAKSLESGVKCIIEKD